MIQLQHLRRQANTIAGDLPPEGWIPADPSASGRVAITHPDRPGLLLEAKIDWGHSLLGQTFSVWIRTPDGWADVLGESVLAGRDLAQAALEDVRRTYGPEGQAAQALAELLGAAWAAGEASAWLRVDLHRPSVPEGELVLMTGSHQRRRRLPGGPFGPLARITDKIGRVRYSFSLDAARFAGISAHARLAAAEEARGLARACRLDDGVAEAIARRVLRDLAGRR